MTEATNAPVIPSQDIRNFAVDIEHNGIRAAGCGTLVAGTVLGFLFFNTFVFPGGFLLNALIGMGIGGLTTFFIDRYLTGRWLSGRELHINDERIALTRDEKIERVVDPEQYVNVLLWRFAVKKSQRVKRGWYVIACALEQEDNILPVYSFISPDDFDNLPLSNHFKMLEAKKSGDSGASVRDMRQAGAQRRLHEAERDRSMNGAELQIDQFMDYINTLQTNFPRWMPQQ
ncbi:MAG: hypothetical protein KC546_12425 [Anaerolineae bacterium]|nr:hypothetical protein [Anaerolineae bacterium]